MEGKPELIPLELNSEIERERAYTLHLRPELAKEVYASLIGAINRNEPKNPAEDNIDHTFLTRKRRANLIELSNKFTLPPNVVVKEPSLFYELPVTITNTERKLIQEEIQKRYGASPVENTVLNETLDELNGEFNKAEMKAKVKSGAEKIKNRVLSFSKGNK